MEQLWTDDQDPNIASLERSLTSLGSSFLIHCQRDLHGILELPRINPVQMLETYHTHTLIKADESPWYRSQRLMSELRPYGSRHVPPERFENLADAVTEKWFTEGRIKDRASQHAVSAYLVGQMQTSNKPAKTLEPKLEYPRAQMGAYISALSDRSRSAIQITLNQAVMNNSSAQELAQTLFSRFGTLNRDWRRIAITEIARNRADGHLSALVGQTVRWNASRDACAQCRAMHGKTFTVDKGDPKTHVWMGKSYVPQDQTLETWAVIPAHPNCRCRWVGLTRATAPNAQVETMIQELLNRARNPVQTFQKAPNPRLTPEYKTVTRDGKTYIQRYYHAVQSNTPLERHPSGETPNAPLPPGFISLAQHPVLNAYDESLNQVFKALRVYNPDKLEHLTKPELARLDTAFRRLELEFKDLYQDNDLFNRTRQLIKDLTTDMRFHPPRNAILKTFTRLATGQLKTSDPEALTMLTLIESREQHWERLLSRLGESPIAPKGFRLYRGSQDETGTEFIPIVLRAWLNNEEFKVPQHSLASWSFHHEAALSFANKFGNVQNGVIMGSDLQFFQIQADKLTDGGNFLYWWNQYEAVVGTPDPAQPIKASPMLSSILYNGEWYTYLDRFELEKQLRK